MLDKLYLQLPRSLQNIAMTAYGWKTYRQRFGGLVPGPYDNLHSVFDESDDELRVAQETRFAKLVSHVASTVPYYQALFQRLAIAPRDVNVGNMTEVFPVISKQQILDRPEQFITTDPRYLKGSFSLYTSGSSGTPLRVVSSLEATRINYAYYALALSEYGLHYRSRSTTFAGRIIHRGGHNHPARYDHCNNTQYMSSYQVSADSIEKYVRELNNWRPEFIDAYPSVLLEIVSLASGRGLRLQFSPKLIITSSESLTNGAREKIEAYFSAPIIDNYGSTEMVAAAYSRKGKYYVHPLYSVMELQPLGESSYALLATGLINFAMPLIRYAIGDSVTTSAPKNAYCYEAIDGRVDDVIVTPEGRRVGRLDPAFKGVEGIEFAQVVQHAVDRLEVKVVLNEASKAKFNARLLVSNFRDRTSPQMQIEISYHDDIQRGANGKFKTVVSLT